MDYSEATNYLQSLTDLEKSPDILYNSANYDPRRMSLLLKELGNPHMGRRTIHIAGTKGKGSTAAMISSILVSARYNTGRFTSPHLFSWQERIAFNNRPITKNEFANLTEAIRPYVNTINAQGRYGRLTTFEVLTAMAFCYFREKKADFQVLEAGMGGRLDATNMVDNPDVCIITSISLDHTQILGNTVARIAVEKAGIIKAGCSVISAPQAAGAMAAIEKRCKELKIPLVSAGRDITWEYKTNTINRQVFLVHGKQGSYRISIPLLGDYQMENAALSVAAAEALNTRGFKIDCTDIVCGLRNVKWPARLEVINRSPLVIIDGAHNPYSIGKLVESIRKYFVYKNVFVIFGSSQDKDIGGMVKELSGFAGDILISTSPHPRAAAAGHLQAIFQKAGMRATVSPNVKDAVSSVLTRAGGEDLVLATGSLFLAAAVKEEVSNKGKKI
jgi:dihydrofolate synthase / folylpolyglutamate synthase